MISRDQDKFVFYVNNYINWDQFNQLYDSDWMEKNIRNANVVICQLGLALIKAINHRLEVAREEAQKKKEIVERQRIKAIIVKCRRVREGIRSSSEEEEEL